MASGEATAAATVSDDKKDSVPYVVNAAAIHRIPGRGAWGGRKGKKCAQMAHFGAREVSPQRSHRQATGKPPGASGKPRGSLQ